MSSGGFTSWSHLNAERLEFSVDGCRIYAHHFGNLIGGQMLVYVEPSKISDLFGGELFHGDTIPQEVVRCQACCFS